MSYYIRVLGLRDTDIHIDELIQSLATADLTAKFEFDPTEDPGKWTMLDIRGGDGELLAQLERNPVADDELGKEELEEFKVEIQDCLPKSSARWLGNYLARVKVIYAFNMLNAAFENENFEVISNLQKAIWIHTKGILQADGEGFSNEDGDHILWQFSDEVTGNLTCAIRTVFGTWKRFVMDAGNISQRKEFQDGKVPKGAKRL